MCLEETSGEVVKWTEHIRNEDKWRAFVNALMNLRIS
jgi:hypothetical protein